MKQAIEGGRRDSKWRRCEEFDEPITEASVARSDVFEHRFEIIDELGPISGIEPVDGSKVQVINE